MAEKKAAKKATKKAAKKAVKVPDDIDKLFAEIEAADAVDVTLDPPTEDKPQDVIDRGGPHDDPDVADDFVRTADGAARWAWGQVKTDVDDYEGLCYRFVRRSLHIPPLAPSAIAGWTMADRKVRTDRAGIIPRGHAVFWRGGNFGHVALSLGDGYCISTDIRTRGEANKTRIDNISQAWNYDLLGYTKDLNGEQAPRPVEGPRLTNREWRIRRLRQAIATARKHGNKTAVRELSEWLSELRR